MKPRIHLIGGAIFAMAVLWGCTGYHLPSKAPERATLIGTYVYWSGDSGEPHSPDRLTLEADGKYVLVHMPGGHPGAKEEGRWQLYDDLVWNVALDKSTYPIEVKGQHVRLLIDDDLNIWYEKSVAVQDGIGV